MTAKLSFSPENMLLYMNVNFESFFENNCSKWTLLGEFNNSIKKTVSFISQALAWLTLANTVERGPLPSGKNESKLIKKNYV